MVATLKTTYKAVENDFRHGSRLMALATVVERVFPTPQLREKNTALKPLPVNLDQQGRKSYILGREQKKVIFLSLEEDKIPWSIER